jgi:hypothetical protein
MRHVLLTELFVMQEIHRLVVGWWGDQRIC